MNRGRSAILSIVIILVLIGGTLFFRTFGTEKSGESLKNSESPKNRKSPKYSLLDLCKDQPDGWRRPSAPSPGSTATGMDDFCQDLVTRRRKTSIHDPNRKEVLIDCEFAISSPIGNTCAFIDSKGIVLRRERFVGGNNNRNGWEKIYDIDEKSVSEG